MQVLCCNRPEPIATASDGPLSDEICAGYSTALRRSESETLEYRPSPPPTIGRFRLLEMASAGAFGTVWKAYDTDLDRTVAVKVPRQGQLEAAEAGRFLQEARNASQLRHPNIVAMHEVGRHGETVYIVAEYIDGQTLAEWSERQRPGAREVAGLCRKIAQAVHYAHEEGVIHRDLKPANILVDADGEPHVTDFGLARRIAEESPRAAEGLISGTPAYMSPEQLRGDNRHVDRRADVYAMGVILFELLTGQRPFRGSIQKLVSQVLETDAPSPREFASRIPRDLEGICMKCLEKDPRRRYPSADALAADLGRFLDGQPVTSRPVAAPVRAWRWCKRNRLVAVLTAVLLLVLTAGLAAATSQWLRAAETAAREADARRELETLTRQLFDLAERLRKFEDRRPAAESSAIRRTEAGTHAEPRLLKSSSLDDLALVGEVQKPDAAQPRPAPSLGRKAREDTKRNSMPARLAEMPSGVELRAEARIALQRIEQISPAMAQQCRGAFPELLRDL